MCHNDRFAKRSRSARLGAVRWDASASRKHPCQFRARCRTAWPFRSTPWLLTLESMQERDSVLRELTELTERLAAVPDYDYKERACLLAQQTELREKAASLWGTAGRDRDEVKTELRRLEAIRDDLVEHGHINPAAYAGGGTGGGFAFTSDAWKLNRQIDAAHDRDALEKRIAYLRVELAAGTNNARLLSIPLLTGHDAR